jgi:CDP-diacylglycerol--serine O-phosphatidyltransferase
MRPSLTTPARVSGRRRRPRLVALQALPTLVTLGNVVAGFLAMSYAVDAAGSGVDSATRETLWAKAAWAIGFGMLCDVLDGFVARLTGAASSFGAELDSLADMVTFGAAPALLAKSVVQSSFPTLSAKVATALALIYLLGAALRLARYNVESNRVQEPGHRTIVFRGLPSPGAAGVIASLILVRHEFADEHWTWVGWAFLAGAPTLGLLMVSRFGYPHLVNRFLSGQRPPLVLLLLPVVVYLAWQHLEAAMAAVFCAYAASGPLLWVVRAAVGRPRWAEDEDDDEDEEGSAAVVPPADADEVSRS